MVLRSDIIAQLLQNEQWPWSLYVTMTTGFDCGTHRFTVIFIASVWLYTYLSIIVITVNTLLL